MGLNRMVVPLRTLTRPATLHAGLSTLESPRLMSWIPS